MRFAWAIFITLLAPVAVPLHAQQSQQEWLKQLDSTLSAKYGKPKSLYSPFACDVLLDAGHTKFQGVQLQPSTVPTLSRAAFKLRMDAEGNPTVAAPAGVDAAKLNPMELLLWQTIPKLITGSMTTWYSVGVNGPYPPQDGTVLSKDGDNVIATATRGQEKEVATYAGGDTLTHLQRTGSGYSLEETPSYAPLHDIQFYSGADVMLTTGSGVQHIKTAYTYDAAKPWPVPTSVRMTIDQNIDAVLNFSGCTAQ